MTTKVRYTLCLTWPGEPDRRRLHGMFTERDQADKRAVQWNNALKATEIAVTVLPVFPATATARDYGMPAPYQAAQVYEYAIQANMSAAGSKYGWEDECVESDPKEARDRLREYRENQPQYPHRIKKRKPE